jgi:hypothetical protein
MTYGTTPLFLEYFGLRRLEDLPAADELRRIPLQKSESLLTVEPGLATAPPEQLTQEQMPGSPPAPGRAVPAAEVPADGQQATDAGPSA